MVTFTVFARLATLLVTIGLVSPQDDAAEPHLEFAVADTIVVIPAEQRAFSRPELPLGAVPYHVLVSPAAAGFDADALQRAERAIEAEIARGGFPGAALTIGRMDNIVVERGFGRLGWSRFEPRVDAEYTVYDLASLTKPMVAMAVSRPA
jgi:CubicO group peptidase (beta-lactamase class C family)